jgi:hypothetical protein
MSNRTGLQRAVTLLPIKLLALSCIGEAMVYHVSATISLGTKGRKSNLTEFVTNTFYFLDLLESQNSRGFTLLPSFFAQSKFFDRISDSEEFGDFIAHFVGCLLGKSVISLVLD